MFWLYSLVCFPGSSMLQYVPTFDLFLQLSIFYCMDNTSCLSEHLDCLFAVVSSTMGTCAQVFGCTSFLAVLGNHILSGYSTTTTQLYTQPGTSAFSSFEFILQSKLLVVILAFWSTARLSCMAALSYTLAHCSAQVWFSLHPQSYFHH